MICETLDRKKIFQHKKVESNPFTRDGYMTVEEFRKWGHEMVDNKFAQK